MPENNDHDTIRERALVKLERDLGEEYLALLHDPCTVELVLNEDGTVWHERLSSPMVPVGTMSPSRARALIETIAGCHGKEVTWMTPLLEAEFPLDGSRFAGQIPPVVSSPVFSIRKRACAVFSLVEQVEQGTLTHLQKEIICEAISARRNILVTGGTGTGKTTFVNSMISEITDLCPQERLFIIEDTAEIQCQAKNRVQYRTTPEVGMTDLLRTCLRMRPDRIMVGEVRGPEALDLLMAWNTGHEGGCATLHANSARAGLDRMAMLVSMHPRSPSPAEPFIAEVVHLIIHLCRTKEGRKVREILGVNGWKEGQYAFFTPKARNTETAFFQTHKRLSGGRSG